MAAEESSIIFDLHWQVFPDTKIFELERLLIVLELNFLLDYVQA